MLGEMIAVLAILCGTGITTYALRLIFGGKGPAKQDAVLGELRALREEVQALRRQNNDVVLALDTNVQRLDHRLTHVDVETRGQLEAGASRRTETENAEVAQRR